MKVLFSSVLSCFLEDDMDNLRLDFFNAFPGEVKYRVHVTNGDLIFEEIEYLASEGMGHLAVGGRQGLAF